ncbi:MAG: RNA polymerase sigma factor [Bacteroidetes bacterium]|nr:RNA polymerase sigma factor [Bacteroidota bacterium]
MNPSPTLLKDCRKGDRKAQYQLFKTCFPVLMGVCSRYAQDQEWAKSGMNEAFLRILNNLKRYDTGVPFEAWIRRIAINVMIDEFRKSRKVRELIEYRDFSEANFEETVSESPFDDGGESVPPEELEQLIQMLPPVSQKVFNLFVIDGFSHPEIAKLLDVSVGTSKWHLSSARKKLREWVTDLINDRPTVNKTI